MSLKYTCGPIDPSGCILYTGDIPEFVADPSCNIMLDELLEKYGAKVTEILEDIDLTELQQNRLNFNPASIDVKGLEQVQIDAISDLITRVEGLETSGIGSSLLEIDLGCMTPIAAPCAQATNTYSILSLFTILFNELCQIKSQLP